MEEVEITAHHEAAHALQYLYAQQPFAHVTMEAGPDQQAATTPHPNTPIDFFVKAQIALMGPAADAYIYSGYDTESASEIMLNQYWGSILGGVHIHDFADADMGDAGDYVEMMIPFTIKMVAERWPTIQAMAQIIMQKEVTTYEELEHFKPDYLKTEHAAALLNEGSK